MGSYVMFPLVGEYQTRRPFYKKGIKSFEAEGLFAEGDESMEFSTHRGLSRLYCRSRRLFKEGGDGLNRLPQGI